MTLSPTARATKQQMLTKRHGLAAVVNGKIYAIGGLKDVTDRLSTVEEYDPVADSWTTKQPMPTPRYWLAAAQAIGRIYAIGGYDVNNVRLNTVEEYDPTTDTWSDERADANGSLRIGRCFS